MADAFIVDAVRTPRGKGKRAKGDKPGGALSEIHPQEFALLVQMFGYVNPGRYWLGANLTGGYEGGPAIFDLRAAAKANAGGDGYNRNTLFGGLMSDGACSGYLHPSGATVMTGDC